MYHQATKCASSQIWQGVNGGVGKSTLVGDNHTEGEDEDVVSHLAIIYFKKSIEVSMFFHFEV